MVYSSSIQSVAPKVAEMLPSHINSVNKKSYGWHDVIGESESIKPLRSGPSNSMDSSYVNKVDKSFQEVHQGSGKTISGMLWIYDHLEIIIYHYISIEYEL